MSTIDQAAEAVAAPRVARKPRRTRPKFKDTWWRHGVGILAALFALFPVGYIVSAAFSSTATLTGARLIPRHVTLDNFRTLFNTNVSGSSSQASAHYARWLLNSVLVAGTTAILSVLLSAFAAYAFSRFRFRGRRLGMLFLLLIQMFPQLLLVVALYLIVLRTGDVFSILGLNHLTALIVVYLGGAMGVNTWLMKGFFDTIPSELDESARVDGATPAQVFWGVVLPLAAPVLAVIALISFVGAINEFIIASAILQTTDHFTLGVGMQSYIDQKYAEHWGPFAAGVLIAAVPVVLLFTFLQRYIVSGLTAGSVKG
jgi:arabinogalactan oligomer / maltooligosaccharide transport system permease protein